MQRMGMQAWEQMPLQRQPTRSKKNKRWLNSAHYSAAREGFVKYDPEAWLPTLKFQISSFMSVPWFAIVISNLAMTTYCEYYASEEHKAMFELPLDAHIVLGYALSFLIVMRTDTCMDKWQDARTAWQTIVDCCQSIGAQTAPALEDEDAHEELLMKLMAFAMCLKAHLRGEKISKEECGSRMDWAYVRQLNKSSCPPVQALKGISECVRFHLPRDPPSPAKGGGSGIALGSAIYDETSEQVRVINHAVGECRNIRNTPMTLGYVTTLRSFLILWLATLPFSMIGEFGWFGAPAHAFIAFLFLNIEQMAVEIEQPFGDDPNDLPQEEYIIDLEESLLQMTPTWVPNMSDSEGEDAEDAED